MHRTTSEKMLHQLALHPLSSARQVARYTGDTLSAVRSRLARLEKEGWIEGIHPHEAILPVRRLYLPTARGLSRLAEMEGLGPEEYARRVSLSRSRLLTLAVRAEAAFQARNVILGLGRLGSLMRGWRAMARISTPKGPLLLDGAATYKFQGRIVQIALEIDSGPRAEVQIEKLYSLLRRYPALQLVVVCWSQAARERYLSLIRREALALGTALLPAYIVLGSDLIGEGYRAPIWYSNYEKRCTAALSVSPPPGKLHLPWPPAEGARSFRRVLSPSLSELAEMARSGNFPKTLPKRERLAGLALALSPLQKRILELVQSHPLLNETDLAILSEHSTTEVKAQARQLVNWEMLRVPRQDELGRDCFALGPWGMAYLAARAGWGTAVMSYARARGWTLTRDGSPRLGKLLANFDHTRCLNSLLVALKSDPDIELLEWRSEPDTRTCFPSGNKWYCVKPDARSTVRVRGREYHLALEFERTTTSYRKLHAKILAYYRWWLAGYHRSDAPHVLILMVTTGERRARAIVGMVQQVARELGCRPIPLLVTWQKQLIMSGMLAPIWLGPLDDRPRRCFDGGER